MSVATDSSEVGHGFEDTKKTVQNNVQPATVKNGVETDVKLSSSNDIDFDTVIGHIEDMLIDEEFHDLQLSILEKYWEEFADTEENKHIYMTIFMEYTNEVESFINKYIKKFIPNFEMEALIVELEKRRSCLEGEVFEVLFTLTDFNVFKEMFLDYRLMKEGTIIDLDQSLYVSPIQ
ncbi:UNVERIFIED_CONTAM: hypothetical protein PYX00_006606 [Menopon gallinae]|uniref:ADP-ribosylation factor-like protein 2-binding protein n=1 Tax=Menopon gallinae TaxID=328185 RepID=A0AAW2HVW9_9NEOP